MSWSGEGGFRNPGPPPPPLDPALTHHVSLRTPQAGHNATLSHQIIFVDMRGRAFVTRSAVSPN